MQGSPLFLHLFQPLSSSTKIPPRIKNPIRQDALLSIPPLPHQILIGIFSHLTTSPRTLYQVLLTSRTYHDLAKPSLYFHIKITSLKQRELLKEIRRDDAKLVRRLTIQGNGTSVGTGCLEAIFKGELLDISCIRTIHAAELAEQPKSGYEPNTIPIKSLQPASELIELSINGHQGGGVLWNTLFWNHELCLPKLSRLGINEVTSFTYTMKEPLRNSKTKYLELFGEEPFIHQGNRTLHNKLDVIVCNHRFGLGGKEGKSNGGVSTKHLVLCAPPTPQTAGWLRLGFKGGFNVKFFFEEGHEIPPNSNFQMLLEGAKQTKPPRARYLAFPYYKIDLNKEVRGIMSEFEKLGAKIYYRADQEGEERESVSIIPRQFVHFVAREKRKEMEAEDSGSSSGSEAGD
ncbi:hypothetical protein JCM5350_004487 [Sporobolomyces pararoseus]